MKVEYLSNSSIFSSVQRFYPSGGRSVVEKGTLTCI